jgi:ERCC4-type nuclease
MKPLHNIFSKSKKKEKTLPPPKTNIIIDTREKQSLIAAELLEKEAHIAFEKLDIGDYIIGDTIIERKTFSDFISSMINKRLQEQLVNLKKYDKHLLIIEGFNYEHTIPNIHKNAIKGMLLSIALDFKIPILFTENEKDTASILILTAKKYEHIKNPRSIRHSKEQKTSLEQKQFILEGFPGIGPTIAKELLKKHDSLQEIFNATKQDLQTIDKLNEKKIENFKRLLES